MYLIDCSGIHNWKKRDLWGNKNSGLNKGGKRGAWIDHDADVASWLSKLNTAVNTMPTAFQSSNYPMVHGPNSTNMHYTMPVLIVAMAMTTLNYDFFLNIQTVATYLICYLCNCQNLLTVHVGYCKFTLSFVTPFIRD